MAGQFVEVCKASEIAEGKFKRVAVKGRRLLICRAQGKYYAIDDTCTHDNGPLADGFLDGTAIECPRHGARFDIRDGQVLCLPAAASISSYPVQVDGDDVQVNIGHASAGK